MQWDYVFLKEDQGVLQALDIEESMQVLEKRILAIKMKNLLIPQVRKKQIKNQDRNVLRINQTPLKEGS